MNCSKCGAPATCRVGLTHWCDVCKPPHVKTYPLDERDRDPQPVATPAPSPNPASPWPPPGERVLYTLGNGPSARQQRPAIVIRHADPPGTAEQLRRRLAGAEGAVLEDGIRAALIARIGSVAKANLARPLVLFVLTDPAVDGLEQHTVSAAYSKEPLAWHWTPRPAEPERDLP